MKLVVALETRFIEVGGQYYGLNSYDRFWRRYQTHFDEVLVFARAIAANDVPSNCARACGPGVKFLPVPYYHGSLQYLRRRRQLANAASAALSAADAAILRIPGLMGTSLWKAMQRQKRAYAVEVVGDPWEVFAPGGARTPLRPLVRRLARGQMVAQCRNASVAMYVTREALQRRYPSSGMQFGCSDVALSADDFAGDDQIDTRIQRYREVNRISGSWRIIHIGTMEQNYKRQDLLIRAVNSARKRGLDCTLTLVGSGRLEKHLRNLARSLNLDDHINFAGQLAGGSAIRSALMAADLFVLPSLTEGLPRVLLEAMACGLPCLASDVGGIGELLAPEDLFSVRTSPESLCGEIEKLLKNPDRMIARVRENRMKAREYDDARLAPIRNRFYEAVHRHVGSGSSPI